MLGSKSCLCILGLFEYLKILEHVVTPRGIFLGGCCGGVFFPGATISPERFSMGSAGRTNFGICSTMIGWWVDSSDHYYVCYSYPSYRVPLNGQHGKLTLFPLFVCPWPQTQQANFLETGHGCKHRKLPRQLINCISWP